MAVATAPASFEHESVRLRQPPIALFGQEIEIRLLRVEDSGRLTDEFLRTVTEHLTQRSIDLGQHAINGQRRCQRERRGECC